MNLCDSCAKDWMAWLDYRVTPPVRLINPGGDSVRAVMDGRRLRVVDWKRTITFQQKLIADICRRNHAGQPEPGTVPP